MRAALLAYARAFVDWLSTYAKELQTFATLAGVLITLAGVLVALYYACLTRRLARTAADQARTAADQAKTTRDVFEAGHRPYLQALFSFEELRYYDAGNFDLRFSIHNHGTVPAALVGWHMEITFNGAKVVTTPITDRDVVVFPGERTAPLLNERRSTSWSQQQPPGQLQLDLFVEYRRLGDERSSYLTKAVVTATGSRTHWEMVTTAR